MAREVDTCWTLVHGAADGDGDACSVFARSYLGIVRAFLAQRWRGSPTIGQLDDAVQEVFLDLFRKGGALTRLDRERAPSFRSFLFGVAHKVALRHEERMAKQSVQRGPGGPEPDETPDPGATMSRMFDRAWALRVIQSARERQAQQAEAAGEAAQRRVELLRLRFADGMPIRDIAKLWQVEAEHLHREYARAREEFKRALRAVVRHYHVGTAAAVEHECQNLLALLE